MTTKEFLTYFPGFCIQTFDDSRKKDKDFSLTTSGSPKNYTQEMLQDLNKRGAGIFFSPNSFPSGIRRTENCAGVNAWIVECDELSIDEQWNNLQSAPLKPSFIVQSKNSLHAYWLAKNGTIENYKKVVKGLIKYFHGDEACKDITRVFRVPGMLHQKDRDNFLVGLVDENPDRVYTEDQMLTAYPLPADSPEQSKQTVVQNTDDFWKLLGSLDNKSVLVKLSGQPIINGEIYSFHKRASGGEYIYVNDEMCDAWIDEVGMIGSGKRGGPTWIQWLEYYGYTKSDIARWAKDHLEEVQNWVRSHEQSKVQRQLVEIDKPVAPVDYKLRYTWGTRILDTSFSIIKRSSFVLVAARRSSGKTTYTFDMACKNALKGHKVLYLSLEMDEQNIKENVARKHAGYTVEEEYDYKVPEAKKQAFDRKMRELDSIPNLYLKGVRRGGNTLWETILEIINSYQALDLIFIDNLDLIEGLPREDDLERQKRIVKNVMTFTSSRQIPVVLIHHYRKANKGGKDLGMDDISGSGKIADGADIVVKVSRNNDPEALYPEKYLSSIYLQKGRGYPECVRDVYFIRGTFVDEPPRMEQYYHLDQDKEIEKVAELYGGVIVN